MVENKNFIARWAQFQIEPGSHPPAKVRIGIQSNPQDSPNILLDVVVFGGKNVPDMVEKIETTLKKLNIPRSKDFTLIYSLYGSESTGEIEIAYLVKEHAEKNGWNFERAIPAPDFKNST